MLDYPLQFLFGLGLLLGWRIWAYVGRKRPGNRLPVWRRLLRGLVETLALVLLLMIIADGTRFVGINFCLDLWANQTWCNHPSDGPTGADQVTPGSSAITRATSIFFRQSR